MSQQYYLASMPAWLSSTGTSHHNLLSSIFLIRLSAVNSNPRTGIAPQSLNSSSQPLPFPGDRIPAGHMYGCGKDYQIFIPFRLPQISCFTFRLKCFSSDSENCPSVGIGPLLQFPQPLRVGSVLLILLFFSPNSFILQRFAWFYIFFSPGQVFLSTLRWCSA